MKTETFILPEHYLSALFNDDTTGLDESDIAALDKFTEEQMQQYTHFWAIDYDDEPGFLKYHDMRHLGVLACDCYNVTFDIGEPL